MMPEFLSLPCELRQQIYLHLLPIDLHVTPRPYSLATKTQPIQYYLFAHDRTINCSDTALFKLCKPNPGPRSSVSKTAILTLDYFTLSIRRVNRLIHYETKELFWSRVSFAFSSGYDFIHTTKNLGQVPSRMIQHVTLDISFKSLTEYPDQRQFQKAINMLASQTRYGGIKSVTLKLKVEDFVKAAHLPEEDDFTMEPEDNTMLLSLVEAMEDKDNWRCERAIGIRGMPQEWEDLKEELRGGELQYIDIMRVARDIHRAWRGKFYLSDTLIWEMYEPYVPREPLEMSEEVFRTAIASTPTMEEWLSSE